MMRANLRLTLGALLALASALGVYGGSPAWEHQLRIQPPHPVERLEVDEAGYAVRGNDTHDTIAKRWFAMSPQNGPGRSKLWPSKTISFCYQTQLGRDTMHAYFVIAVQKWRDKGLEGDQFKYNEVANPGQSCSEHPQRERILMIIYDANGGLSSNVGLPSLSASEPDWVGPTMHLTDRRDIGKLNVVGNVAHEIGHAWGLKHEHQNYFFWSRDSQYQGLGRGAGPAFGIGQSVFNCAALKDYQRVMARIDEQYANDPERAAQEKTNACTQRSAAADWDFSAKEWLPDLAFSQYEYSGEDAYDDIDWESIMLYPSGAGGLGPASPPNPGGGPDQNDNRQNVLTRHDGTRIGYNFDPSVRDVQGIKELYDDDDFPQGLPVLPNQPGHKSNSPFKKLFGRGQQKANNCGYVPW